MTGVRLLVEVARRNRFGLALLALAFSVIYVAWTVTLITLMSGVWPRQADVWRPLWLSAAAWTAEVPWPARLGAFVDDPVLSIYGESELKTWTYSIALHQLAEILPYSAAAALLFLVLREVRGRSRAPRAGGLSAGWGAYAGASSVGAATAAGSVGACCGAAPVPLVLLWFGAGGTAAGLAEALSDPYSLLGHALWAAGIVALLAVSVFVARRAERALPAAQAVSEPARERAAATSG